MKRGPTSRDGSSRLKSGSSKSISASAPTVTAMPGTMLMKNSQCQENHR